jgi:hypothetical protein
MEPRDRCAHPTRLTVVGREGLPEVASGGGIDEPHSKAEFTMTAARETGYSYADLEPGSYLYVCPLPVGGKTKGKPHFMDGMYGSTTVS